MISEITFDKNSKGYLNNKETEDIPRKKYTQEYIDSLPRTEIRRNYDKYYKTVEKG